MFNDAVLIDEVKNGNVGYHKLEKTEWNSRDVTNTADIGWEKLQLACNQNREPNKVLLDYIPDALSSQITCLGDSGSRAC
jgi:hypothetical protein